MDHQAFFERFNDPDERARMMREAAQAARIRLGAEGLQRMERAEARLQDDLKKRGGI